MPNKEKPLKTVSKPNGKVNTAINIASETNHVAASDKKRNSKNKNKLAKNNNSSTSANQIVVNGESSIDHSVDDDEVRAVSEELLKRLQLNGTSVTRCTSNGQTEDVVVIADKGESDAPLNNGANSSNGANDSSQPQQKQPNHNNNNNNCKVHNKNNNNNRSKQAKTVNSRKDSAETNLNDSENVQCNGNHGVEIDQKPVEVSDAASNVVQAQPNLESSNEIAHDQQMPTTSKESNQSNLERKPCKPCKHHHHHHHCHVHPSTSETKRILTATSVKSIKTPTIEITFKEYENESQMPDIMRVIERELSEPYSIYTYRYFIHNWPKLCFLAMDGNSCIGAIVCKLDIHRQMTKRGYIAMLAVDAAYRKLKVGTTLVQKAIEVIHLFYNFSCKKVIIVNDIFLFFN